jgi:signal transduction histidine kinase
MSERWAWMRRARGSVRLRVTLLAAGLFAVTLFVASAVLLQALERSLIDDLDASARTAMVRRFEELRATGLPPDAAMIPMVQGSTVARTTTIDSGVGRSMVIVGDPSLFDQTFRTGSDAGGSPPTATYTPADAGSNPSAAGIETIEDQAPTLLGIDERRNDFMVSQVAQGGLVLAAASPLDQVRDSIAATRGLLWLIGPALVGLVVLLSWLLVGRALRPVHAVTSRVAAIGSHSLHERVPVPRSHDEIAELARTMNSMLGRLETSTSASRRLVSDASHELRTPVTVMRTELEVARTDTEPDWDASSGVLLLELDRLQEMIDDLLLLARGDEQALATSHVTLDDVVRDAAARRRRVAVEVALDGGPHVTVGDDAAIKRALDHVVANAARHADEAVAITVTAANGDVVVHVDDDGPGIPEADRGTVVQRFVRLDEGRDRDHGGAGLGLAVTFDVVTAHGGRLAIDDSPLGGARVTLTFPALSFPALT